MLGANIEGVEFICANTDAQALNNSEVRTVLQLGSNITKGLGQVPIHRWAGKRPWRPGVSRKPAGLRYGFITAGMGGGTGTGGAPVVAEVAKELGILTVAVVTKAFPFEGQNGWKWQIRNSTAQ